MEKAAKTEGTLRKSQSDRRILFRHIFRYVREVNTLFTDLRTRADIASVHSISMEIFKIGTHSRERRSRSARLYVRSYIRTRTPESFPLPPPFALPILFAGLSPFPPAAPLSQDACLVCPASRGEAEAQGGGRREPWVCSA